MQNKLPLPRLQRETRESGGRTGRACDSCRERKIKCDGSRPVCSQCRVRGLLNCGYSEAKFVRQQKELQSLRRQVESYEELLRNISQEVEAPIGDRITKALKSSYARSTKRRTRSSSASSSSSLGSLDDINVVSEDPNRDRKSRSTGYMGKNSEIVWMQRLDFEATKQSGNKYSSSTTSRQTGESIASLNYHLDYRSLPDPDVVNAFILPPRGLADRLFQVYLNKVQITLPFLRHDLFLDQYRRCFETTQKPGRKWLAVFNLILAIGCVFSRLCQEGIGHDTNEDLFFARARALSGSENILYDHDDLQQVQAEALTAFFFLVVSQINRSWKMIGIAARSGIALGINLQKKNVELDVNSGEARKQLWWSIFHLEHLLSVMTGRVSCLWDTSSSAPPPLASPSITHTGPDIDQPMSEPPGRINDIQWTMYLDQEQVESQRTLLESITPSPSLYFFYMVDLSLISHAISNGVYATDSPRIGWARVEGRIALYSKKVDRWVLSLHPSFCFQDSYDNPLPRSRSPFQISLALNYYSARIVLNRPCLNRPAIEKTSGSRIARSRSGNISALACLQASLAVMALLPDQPNLAWCYEILQWWNLLHVLTQATVILLLDVSIGPVPTRSEEAAVPAESAEDVLDGVKKGLSWLHCLGRSSEAARRAFEFCNSCIRRIATTKDLDLGGIPSAHGPSRTFRDSAEGNKAASQQEIQAVALPEHSKPAGPARSLYAGTSYDILFQDPQEGFAGSPGNASAVYDAGIDMSEFISRPAHAEIEEILRTMMGYNA